jgi:flagellar basal body-associated protein FliL
VGVMEILVIVIVVLFVVAVITAAGVGMVFFVVKVLVPYMKKRREAEEADGRAEPPENE